MISLRDLCHNVIARNNLERDLMKQGHHVVQRNYEEWCMQECQLRKKSVHFELKLAFQAMPDFIYHAREYQRNHLFVSEREVDYFFHDDSFDLTIEEVDFPITITRNYEDIYRHPMVAAHVFVIRQQHQAAAYQPSFIKSNNGRIVLVASMVAPVYQGQKDCLSWVEVTKLRDLYQQGRQYFLQHQQEITSRLESMHPLTSRIRVDGQSLRLLFPSSFDDTREAFSQAMQAYDFNQMTILMMCHNWLVDHQ